jgi:GDPmannose 4,6-dehydratase
MDSPDDYIIATGRSESLEYFVKLVFSELGIDWRANVETRKELFRPTDIEESRANPQKALVKLNWQAQYDVDAVVKFMIKGNNSLY